MKNLYNFLHSQLNKTIELENNDYYFYNKRVFDAQKIAYKDVINYIEENYEPSEYKNNKIRVYNFTNINGPFSEQMNLLYPEINIPLMDLYDKLIDIISDFFNEKIIMCDCNKEKSFKIATTSYCVICAILDIADKKGYDVEFINKDGTITTNSEDIFKQFKRFYDLLQNKKYEMKEDE